MRQSYDYHNPSMSFLSIFGLALCFRVDCYKAVIIPSMSVNKIDIDTKTFVRFWLVILGFAVAALLIYRAQTGLIILGISLFLALALNQPVAMIAKKLPGRSRVGAAAVAYALVVMFLGVIIFLVIPPIIQQTAQFIQRMPAVIDSTTAQWSALSRFMEQYNLQSQLDSALASLQSTAASWAGDIGQNLVVGLNSLFSFIAATILVLVLTFLMLIEGPAWLDRLWNLYGNDQKKATHRRIIGRMYAVVSGYVNGQMIVSSLGATISGLFVFIISFIFMEVPSSLAIPAGAITFLLSLIPMFGATIGGVIITLLLALNSLSAAVVYAIYFVVYQQIENNFIAPRIQSRKIDLSALMVLAAVTVGLYMFGVIGGIIAIPIAGSIRVLVEEYLSSRRADQSQGEAPKALEASKKPVSKNLNSQDSNQESKIDSTKAKDSKKVVKSA